MRVGRENEVVLLGAISSEFCAVCTSVGMGLQFISATIVRKEKLRGVEVSSSMRAESPGLLENSRDIFFSVRP